jgi:outer membrane protein OmpA-like peptidoglycan-associated protein
MQDQAEFDLAARELEYELATVARRRRRPRVRVLDVRVPHREFEEEAFDPSTPLKKPDITLSGFEAGSPRLRSAHRVTLATLARNLVAGMAATPPTLEIKFKVVGHEDETGDPASFGTLGLERTECMRDYFAPLIDKLVDKLDPIDRRQVLLFRSSLGPTKPIRSNVTEGGRAMNRRVELSRIP